MPYETSYLVWWHVPSAFSDEKGAVTAEFMLLLPAAVLGLAGFLAIFQLGLVRIEISQLAFFQARLWSIGNEDLDFEGVSFSSELDGQLLCVTATKKTIIEISESACYLAHGV